MNPVADLVLRDLDQRGIVGAAGEEALMGSTREVAEKVPSSAAQAGLGDRAWALRDQRNGRIVSAKRVPRLLKFRATYEVEPTPESAGVVRIETPEGDALYAGQDGASARISRIIGRPVVLDNFAHPDEKACIDRNTVFGDVRFRR